MLRNPFNSYFVVKILESFTLLKAEDGRRLMWLRLEICFDLTCVTRRNVKFHVYLHRKICKEFNSLLIAKHFIT